MQSMKRVKIVSRVCDSCRCFLPVRVCSESLPPPPNWRSWKRPWTAACWTFRSTQRTRTPSQVSHAPSNLLPWQLIIQHGKPAFQGEDLWAGARRPLRVDSLHFWHTPVMSITETSAAPPSPPNSPPVMSIITKLPTDLTAAAAQRRAWCSSAPSSLLAFIPSHICVRLVNLGGESSSLTSIWWGSMRFRVQGREVRHRWAEWGFFLLMCSSAALMCCFLLY